MWEARLWLALDHETPVDIVSTMGPDIEVEQLLELYFVAHPLVDWREGRRRLGFAPREGERTDQGAGFDLRAWNLDIVALAARDW